MYCPLGCGWKVGDLTNTEPTPPHPSDEADNLVTQYSLLVEHLQEDHDALIGGH